jgi:ribonuclease BN (tRNA processing enzyme)
LKLTVVGCSGTFPGPNSAASCYLVEHEGFRLVIDLGHGSLGPLQRSVALDQVDALFLSHLHADHWIDLTAYYVVRRYWHGGPLPALDVYGPSGTRERLVAAYGIGIGPGLHDIFAFRQTAPGALSIGPFALTLVRTAHSVECYAIRVEAGKSSFTYTGDTGESAAVTALADGTDVLLAEATFLQSEPHADGIHLTGQQAGQMARDAGAARLVLTHIPPWHDSAVVLAEAQDVFAGPTALAVPGAAYEV